MHVSMWAVEVNILAAVGALLSAAIWLFAWRKTRQRYMLPLTASWLGLALYWSLIAVSAGPAPMWSRANLALVVRGILLLSVLLMVGGKVALVRLAMRCTARKAT